MACTVIGLRPTMKASRMKILLLGVTGQLGLELLASLSLLGKVYALDRSKADLKNLDALRQVLQTVQPDAIINAAAYTAVDKAESDSEIAYQVNAEAPAFLAVEAQKLGAWLIHYSTDYVFNGEKAGFYSETDIPSPLNVYGKSKLAGDEAILRSGCRHLVFRTSWVFGARGRNFARTILKLAQEKNELAVVADQVGCPASAEFLASSTTLCLSRILYCQDACDLDGLYNLVPSGETNWHAYAVYLLEEALKRGWKLKTKPQDVRPLSTAEYPLPAKRLANSRLSTDKLQTAFGLVPPNWTYYVKRTLDAWTEDYGVKI